MSSHPQHLQKKCKLVSKVLEALTKRDDHRRARGGEKKSHFECIRIISEYIFDYTQHEKKRRRKNSIIAIASQSLFFISFFFFTLRLLLHSLSDCETSFSQSSQKKMGSERERGCANGCERDGTSVGLRWKHDL